MDPTRSGATLRLEHLHRAARLAWASPYTLVGLLLGSLGLLFGGRARRVAGALEFEGGRLARLAARNRFSRPFPAITFGHVVLGVGPEALAEFRAHERVHVRQYERWGPLFGPAYLASSLLQLVRGRHPYHANRFEREAYDTAAAAPRESAPSATSLPKPAQRAAILPPVPGPSEDT